MPPKRTPTPVDRLTPATEAAGLTPGATPSDGVGKKGAGQASDPGLPPLGAVMNVAKVVTGGRKRRRGRSPPPPPPVEPPPDPFMRRVEKFTEDTAASSAAVLRGPIAGDEFDDLIAMEDRKLSSIDPSIMVKDTSMCNHHFVIAALILIPSLFFIALFGAYITTPEGLRPLQSAPANAARLAQLTSDVVTALLSEMEQGARLIGMTDVVDMDPSGRSLTWMRKPFYVEAQKRSNTAIEAAIRFSTNGDVYTQMYEYAGGITVSDAVDITALERVRSKVLIGGAWPDVLRLYDDVVHRIMVYQATVALRNVDGAGLAGFQQIFSAGQLASADLLRLFIAYQNATSQQPGILLNAVNSTAHYNFIANTEAMMDTYEELRYATSGRNDRRSAGRPVYRVSNSPVNYVTLPSVAKDMLNTMLEESFGANVYFWSALNESGFFNQINSVTKAVAALDLVFEQGIPDKVKPVRLVAELACLVLLFVLAVVAIAAHTKNTVQYYHSMDAHDEVNRNATLFHRSLTRTSKFLLMAASLDVKKISSVFRKVAKASNPIPIEESQLYAALGSLRDTEPFLCNTVVAPPPEVPQAAISKHKLFVRPALVHIRGAVVLRVSLSPYHNAFASAGVKQKALQHQMNRYLTLLQETADQLFGPRATVLSVFADYAAMWCNVTKKAQYPVMMATELALTVQAESTRQGIVASQSGERPLISICCGDVLAGHIFNQPPGGFDMFDIDASAPKPSAADAASPAPLDAKGAAPAQKRFRKSAPFGSFVTFGPVTKELTLMTSLSKLHEADLSFNHWAVEAFYYERAAMFDHLSTGAAVLPITAAATPARNRSPSPARGEAPFRDMGDGGSPVASSARRDQLRNAQLSALSDRLHSLRVTFTPLDLIRADIAEDETVAFLRNLEPSGADNRGRYARAVDREQEIVPCYAATRNKGSEPSAMDREWEQVFSQFVAFVVMPTTGNGDGALKLLDAFLAKYPDSGLTRTTDRLRKAIGIGRLTGTVPITASQIKRARLAANLLATS